MLRGQRRAAVLRRHAQAALAVNALKVATTNNRLASAGYAGTKGRYQTSGTRTAFAGQTQHVFPAAYSQIRIVVPGAWFISDSTGEQDLAAPFTIDKMYVRSGSGNKTAVTFGGSRSLVVMPGVDYYLSDPLAAIGSTSLATTDTTNTRLAIGFQGHVAASGDYLPQATPAYFRGDADGDNARMWMYDPAAAAVDIDAAADAIAKPSGAIAISFAPSFFAVGIAKAPTRAVAVFGDSLTFGYNENVDAPGGANYPSEFGVIGPYARAGYDYPNGYPPLQQTAYLLTGVHSEGAGQFLASNARRCRFLDYCNVAHVAYGTNDLGAAAAAQANLAAIYALCRANPNVRKVLGSSIPPRTTSTDGWATAANQTPVAGWASGGEADLLNGWIAAGGGGALDGYADLRAAVRDGGSAVKWLSNGSASYGTQDGIHWQAPTSTLAAAAIRALWMAQAVA